MERGSRPKVVTFDQNLDQFRVVNINDVQRSTSPSKRALNHGEIAEDQTLKAEKVVVQIP